MEAENKPVVVEPAPRRWPLIVWGIVLLGSGFGIGFGVDRLTHRPPPPRPHREETRGFAPQTPPAEVVEQLTEELNLTPVQAGEVAKIYVQRFAEIQKLRTDLLPKVAQQYDQLHSDLKKVLTPEQYQQWDRRYEEVRGRFIGHRGPGRDRREGPPPPALRDGPDDDGPPPRQGPEGRRPPRRDGMDGRYPPPPPRDREGDFDGRPLPPPPPPRPGDFDGPPPR